MYRGRLFISPCRLSRDGSVYPGKLLRNFVTPTEGMRIKGTCLMCLWPLPGHSQYTLGMKMILGVRRINIH